MIKHFTATAYVIEGEKVLLIYHRKFGKWLPPGGHLEADETPPEGVCREVLEETGLEVELIAQENIWVDRWNASSFERPYLCLLERIPPQGDIPAHEHMDLIYLARPKGGALKQDEGVRWFTLEEVLQLVPDKEIFAETQETLRHIFDKIPFLIDLLHN